jgi:lantibiotic leader peptide-processing serine protease
VTLVNIRAGQDSGFVFLQPTIDALTYAGSVGIDVVNMSFFTDPWLFNCLNNPADTPAQQQEQRTVREATQRAVDFARAHGVLPVAALGNQATDLDHPTDNTSPDFPAGAAHPRTIDNSCISVPVETDGVVSVSALGPSGRKAFYSNWGPDQADVAAPGGDSREGFGTTRFNIPENRVLSTLPIPRAQLRGRAVRGHPAAQRLLRRRDRQRPDRQPALISRLLSEAPSIGRRLAASGAGRRVAGRRPGG